jgi:prolyl 4-hydroxylase
MHSSPSPAPSPQSQLSLSAIVQYAFLAGLAYILAGAPLASLLNSSSSGSEDSYNANGKAREGNVVDVRTLESLVIPENNLSCAEHRYKGVYLMSREPLVIYIEGFLREGEGKQIVDLR